MLKKIIFSVLVGILATVFVAQYDPYVQKICATYVSDHIKSMSPCIVACAPKSVRFFLPELIFEDVAISSMDDDSWHWKAQRVAISFSWWHLIKYGCIDIEVRLYGCHIESDVVNGSLAIAPHISQFLMSTPFFITSAVKLVEIHEGSLSIVDKAQDISAACYFSSISKELDSSFKTIIQLTDGNCTVQQRRILSHMMGIGTVMVSDVLTSSAHNPLVAGSIEGRIELPQLDKPTCFVKGTWEKGSGRFAIRHVEQAFTIDPFIVTSNNQGIYVDCVGRFPWSYVWRMIIGNESVQDMQGSCLLRVNGSIDDLKGQLSIEDVHYNQYPLFSAFTISLHKINQLFQGQIKAHMHDAEVSGTWHIKENGEEGAALSLQNSRRFAVPGFPYWYLDTGDCMGTIQKSKNGEYSGSYQCKAYNVVHEAFFNTQGKIHSTNGAWVVDGSIDDCTYKGSGSCDDVPHIHTFQYSSATGESLITLDGQGKSHNALLGKVSYSFARSLLHTFAGFELQGKGSVHFDTAYHDNQLDIGVHLKDGVVRLPYTYNFIDSFDVQLKANIDTRTVYVKDLKCGLHTGNIRCPYGHLRLSDYGSLEFVHLPLVFNHCLVNVKKNLFAMVSGHLLLSKQPSEDPWLKGHLIVDRAQIKDTLVSLDMSRSFLTETGLMVKSFYSAMRLGFTVETKDPIRIDTPLLQTHATAQLNVAGDVAHPNLEGEIVFDSGTIVLPYKPLHITKGKICFEPENRLNPMIELRARNKIKKHIVTLYAHGLLQDYQVVLDSNPPLAEEQIIALLLVGSPEESLNMMVPALIMQNLKMALFGSGSLSFLDNYFKRASVPFSINLVPSFTDQTGRGGLRGGLEITVNDRWRALIQKNFSLSEDTRFELEYLFSDDVGARVVRDEHRDIGGEVEMRWKF